jgi:hypothetical protein
MLVINILADIINANITIMIVFIIIILVAIVIIVVIVIIIITVIVIFFQISFPKDSYYDLANHNCYSYYYLPNLFIFKLLIIQKYRQLNFLTK